MTRLPHCPEPHRGALLMRWVPAIALAGLLAYVPGYLQHGPSWTAPAVARAGVAPILATLTLAMGVAVWAIWSEATATGWR